MKTKYDKDAREAASALWAKLQELPAHQQHEAICAVLKDYACEADKRLDESAWAAKYRDACISISDYHDALETLLKATMAYDYGALTQDAGAKIIVARNQARKILVGPSNAEICNEPKNGEQKR